MPWERTRPAPRGARTTAAAAFWRGWGRGVEDGARDSSAAAVVPSLSVLTASISSPVKRVSSSGLSTQDIFIPLAATAKQLSPRR